MNMEMILAGAQYVGIALSIALLLRVRRPSVGLWSTDLSYQRMPKQIHIEQPTEINERFKG